MVEKYKHDKAFSGPKKSAEQSPGDASRFDSGMPKSLNTGANQDTTNAGEFGDRTPKVKESNLKQTDPDTGRFDKSK